MDIQIDLNPDPKSNRDAIFALAQNCVPLESLKSRASKLGRESRSTAAARFEATEHARRLSNIGRALADTDQDQARAITVQQTRERFIDDQRRRAAKARARVTAALQVPDVSAAIAEFAVATYLVGVSNMGGDLAELATFREMPADRAPGPDNETVKSDGPSLPRRAAAGLPIG
jgi:hypothetical protein